MRKNNQLEANRTKIMLWVISLLGLIMIPLSSATVYNSSIDVGLKAHFGLDEGTGTNAYNNANASANITMFNSPTWSLNGGILNNATNFSKASSQFGNASTLYFPGGVTPKSVSIWAKTNSTGPIIYGGNSTSTDKAFGINLGSSGIATCWGSASLTATAPASNGTWHNYVCTDNTTSRSLYIDGVLIVNVSSTTFNTGSVNNVRIATDDLSNYFSGELDEIGVWNRSLSSNEVYAVFNNFVNIMNYIDLSYCLTNSSNYYLNYTFKNETISQERVNSSISSSFTYWYNDTANTKSLSFTNLSYNKEYKFCSNYPNISYSSSSIYYNAESPQRTDTYSGTIGTSPTSRTLYLLPSSLGSYITFQIINQAQQAITGATITVSSTSFGTVASATTDSAGSATFFLNPLTSYTIVVSKTGYATNTQTIAPTQTQYTIILQQSYNPTTDHTKGISFITGPTNNILTNNTVYNFSYYLTSSYYTIDSFGFSIYNSSGYVFGTNSSTVSGTNLTLALNTGSNSSLTMNYYWIINSSINNLTRSWTIFNTEGSQFSIKQLFTDLNTYTSTGIFGLTSFGMAIFVFLFIMISTGIVTYKYGLNSSSIYLIVFIEVFVFDVVLGMIPNPIGAVTYFPTIVIGIILAALFFKEATQ